jgi:hypothetical protein
MAKAAEIDVAPAEPPNRDTYARLVALSAELLARRGRRFGAFLELWRELERDGFRPRLEYAVEDRAPSNGRATIERP